MASQLGMSTLEPASAVSRVPLSPLLEQDSAPPTQVVPPPDEIDTSDPVPTLSSLLLSTAESLAARFRQPAPAAKAPPAFALPASPAALLSDPTSKEYLASLLALPLPSLQALPSTLATLSTSLDTDLSSLAFTRYSSFLLSHAATQSISTSFNTLSTSLTSLLDSTSALEVASGAFESRVHEVRRKRERMARVRERMEEVEELLEASSVVDACVRAGYWTEAIDVASRLAELHARLSSAKGEGDEPGSGKGALILLDRVRDEVSLALLALRARVLESLLQRGLKLPAAVRGMSILRRMNAGGLGLEGVAGGAKAGMDEEALRIVFLAARWRCLRAELDPVEGQMAASGIKLATVATPNGSRPAPPTEDVTGPEENDERTRWAKRWIELWREVVGETVGMYTEVFLSTLTPSPSSTEPHSLSATAPLSLFLSSTLSSLSSILLATLPALTSSASLSSLLTQLSYCSNSFARYGLEFREIEQIRERVEDRVGAIVVRELEAAGVRWEKEWRAGWEGGIRRRGKERKGIAQWLVVAEGLSTVLSTPLPPPVDNSQPSATSWHHQPSASVALLPPLARFLNAHATALNSLRLLPAISLYPTLRKAQGRALDRATQVLSAFVDAWVASVESFIPPTEEQHDALSNDEKAAEQVRLDEHRLLVFAIAAFGRWVVPWCEGALVEGVYAELQSGEGRIGDSYAREAIRKAEALVARVEGREAVPPPPTPAIDSRPVKKAPTNAAPVVVVVAPEPEPEPSPELELIVEAPEVDGEESLPPALEPELALPASLDPTASPASLDATLEPSLEPTLERSTELIVDSPPVEPPVEEAASEEPEPTSAVEDVEEPEPEAPLVESLEPSLETPVVEPTPPSSVASPDLEASVVVEELPVQVEVHDGATNGAAKGSSAPSTPPPTPPPIASSPLNNGNGALGGGVKPNGVAAKEDGVRLGEGKTSGGQVVEVEEAGEPDGEVI